ncbi:class I SAM-dependent methyltransferase [Bernardetia sp. Wsw4-3y2]|uniref:class I SAM-dependent methyltransferase n=1 Tax=Bernardetia sp. Wsw4-3y2 TaxID=3127471 RepID=UPI0030CE1F23
MKDNFSQHSKSYSIYRPSYPKEVFEIIYSYLDKKQNAWDCGTGNGQVADKLAQDFEKVFATDISQNQIKNAVQKENIVYSIEQAENSSFKSDFFDLIIVAQAIHWFDFNKFYQEVSRTLKKEGVFVVLGYGKLEVNEKIDAIINKLYYDILGKYWDKERKYIDENYQTIPFPFKEVEQKKNKKLFNELEWTLENLIGYLNTWSAVKHYNNQNSSNLKNDAIEIIYQDLENAWKGKEVRTVKFPILLRIGTITNK